MSKFHIHKIYWEWRHSTMRWHPTMSENLNDVSMWRLRTQFLDHSSLALDIFFGDRTRQMNSFPHKVLITLALPSASVFYLSGSDNFHLQRSQYIITVNLDIHNRLFRNPLLPGVWCIQRSDRFR